MFWLVSFFVALSGVFIVPIIVVWGLPIIFLVVMTVIVHRINNIGEPAGDYGSSY